MSIPPPHGNKAYPFHFVVSLASDGGALSKEAVATGVPASEGSSGVGGGFSGGDPVAGEAEAGSSNRSAYYVVVCIRQSI